MVRSHYHYTINSIPIIFLYHCDSSRFPQYSHYIYMVTPPYDPPMCHLYCYLQHKMRIFSIPFLSSSYIVITIQYLKALWGRPHRNTIDRRPKIKKTSGKQNKNKKKQYFPTPLGSLHEKNKKTLRKPKKPKKTIFRNYLEGPPPKNR